MSIATLNRRLKVNTDTWRITLRTHQSIFPLILIAGILFIPLVTQAEILSEATLGIKIPLTKKPTSRPMTVAYTPNPACYYIADGGLAPMASEFEAPVSKSMVHAFTSDGKYLNSAKPGYDNRSLYYNPHNAKLETITYNISSAAGFSPNTGIYTLDTSETGEIKDSSGEVMQFNPAFGDAGTMPSYDPGARLYYAKQKRSNKVWIVDPKQREKVGEISLELDKAGVAFDDITDNFVAFTGVKGQELAALDVDHKAVLIFDLGGKFIGKCALPQDLKLRAHNHYNGTGYANSMLFVYHENEGEFGTYHGYRIFK
ncbi:MAG TPA: hypothetical protein PLR90_02130 [Methylophilus sp.]|nr:hypothetical protein [Methylophilus sp.]HQQ32689.1 hypothetical protein [Methylophilus sp.]